MISESYYKERAIMPIPVCHECSKGIALDVLTYWNYRGSVTCQCKARMNVVITDGQMTSSGPMVPPDYINGLHHDLPQQAIDDYFEAITCLIHRAFKASAVMQRRSLQGALLAKQVPENTPMKMVQWAQSNKMLGPKDVNLANTVSFFGGKGAHPEEDNINLVGELEATQGLRVTKDLLLALFPPPEKAPVQQFTR